MGSTKPQPQPQPGRQWLASVWRVWDKALIYLPLLTMAALALGTYWLVRSTEPVGNKGAREPSAAVLDANDVDYFMRGFTVRSFDAQGRLQNEVFGDQARHFSADDRLEIDAARIRSVNLQGMVTHASANRAISNSDNSEVQLIGNAQVLRQAQPASPARTAAPELRFNGQFLQVLVKQERLWSDQPVQISRGKDTFSGNALAFDHTTGVLELTGKVRVSLQPKNASLPPSKLSKPSKPGIQP